MKDYKLYLIDLDGTIYNGNNVIEYAAEFINYLNNSGKDYLFITNNSTSLAKDTLIKLLKLGIQTDEKNIFNSAQAAASYLKKNNYKKVHLIGEVGLRQSLLDEDIEIISGHAVDAVVVGLDRQVTYDKLSDACSAILNGADFIATNPDRLLPTENGMKPSNGGQMKFLEFVTGKEAIVIGKPSNIIMELAIEKFNYKKEDIVMVGDNYDTDIMSGINIGIDTIHVQTGVTSTEELLEKEVQPTYTITNLKEVFKLKKEIIK